jgi:hypothetical protein
LERPGYQVDRSPATARPRDLRPTYGEETVQRRIPESIYIQDGKVSRAEFADVFEAGPLDTSS